LLANGDAPHCLDPRTALAQIPAVFRNFTILVRATYLLTALLVLACAAPALVSQVHGLFRSARFNVDAWGLFGIAISGLLCALPLRALGRLLHRHQFVPDAHIRERPVASSLVVILGVMGWTLALLAGWVGIRNLPHDDIGGPLAGALMLALMLFTAALLVGELVLVGRAIPATR
jgi:hypothetical protein